MTVIDRLVDTNSKDVIVCGSLGLPSYDYSIVVAPSKNNDDTRHRCRMLNVEER